MLKVVTPSQFEGDLGITNFKEPITPAQGFLMEAVLTFPLVFVVHAVSDSRRNDIKGSAPLAIGLSITASHLCGVCLRIFTQTTYNKNELIFRLNIQDLVLILQEVLVLLSLWGFGKIIG